MLGARGTSAVVVLVAALFGVGCGGNDGAGRTRRPVPERQSITPRVTVPVVHNPALRARLLGAVARTAAAGTARTSISVTLTGLGDEALATGAYDLAGAGVVDLRSGDARLRLSVPRFDRLGGGGAIEQRIVGRVVYTRMPAGILKAGGLPHTVRWLSLDPEHVAASDASSLSQSQADPAGQLAFLAATSDDVRRVGREPVRGVATTHYAGTIELADAARGATRVASVRANLADLGAVVGARRLDVDVWIDPDGRARRIVISVPLSSKPGTHPLGGLGPDATMRIQGDFYAFGAPVQVAAPPQTQVRPYGTLLTGIASG